jgi:hypothetical protein
MLGHLFNSAVDLLDAGNRSVRSTSLLELDDVDGGLGAATLHLVQTPNRKG